MTKVGAQRSDVLVDAAWMLCATLQGTYGERVS